MVATTTWLEHSTLKYCGASWVDKQASDRASTKQEFADSFLLMFHKFGVEACNQAVALTRSFTLTCWLQQEPLRQHLAHKVAARKPRPSTSKQYPGCLRTHSTVKLFSDRFGDFLVRSCHAASESSIRRCGPLDSSAICAGYCLLTASQTLSKPVSYTPFCTVCAGQAHQNQVQNKQKK